MLVPRAPAARAADDDPWLGVDKAKHFGVSTGLGAGAYAGLWLLGSRDTPLLRLALAAGLALMPGLAKEIYDAGQPRNRFSGKDMLYNAVGVTVGALLFYVIERLVSPRRAPVAARANH